MQPLRLIGPVVLACVSAMAVDQLTFARGLAPPGFRQLWRRGAALLVVALVLYVGVFRALGLVGLPAAPLPSEVPLPALFALHAILLAAILFWFLLGFAGAMPPGLPLLRELGRQLGLGTPRPAREAGVGLGLGLLAWPGLLGVLVLIVGVLYAVGGQRLLPTQPPALIVWIAGLPVGLKLGLALSAGVFEELFFRGLLQPRVGIGISTLLFVLAHLSYDQPFLLVGITALSLSFAALVWWRQNIWPAIAAHFLFDAVQLIFLIPWALREWHHGASALGPVAAVGVAWLPW